MNDGFLELTLIVALSAVLGVIARLLKQPTLLAYLAAGVLGGVFQFSQIEEQQNFQVFSDLGIMFLLFLVGMEINYSSLRAVGKNAALLGTAQIALTSAIGYLLASSLGFPPLSAFYVAIALTFSSTIIIVKLLSDKRDLGSLYGKLSIGLLLVQDIVAILVLMILSGAGRTGYFSPIDAALLVITIIALFALMLWLGRWVLPPIFDRVAKSSELLFIVSLAWVFVVAMVVSRLGFSIEIAGLLAGLALANSSEHFQIAARVRPLRDFFLIIFFFSLGASLRLADLSAAWVQISTLSLFVLIGNPLIVLVLMGLMGYKKRTSFLAGISLGQVSEFSLVLAAVGLELGHLNSQTVGVITAVGIISIILSTYLIVHSESLYQALSGILQYFELKNAREPHIPSMTAKKPIILIGFHRTGRSIAQALKPKDLLVVDFDPEVIKILESQGYSYIFGDIKDEDIIEEARLDKARLVICTSPDAEDNFALLSAIRGLKRKPFIVTRAETESDAHELYAQGANYVLLPHVSSGHYLGHLLSSDPTFRLLRQMRKREHPA
ncbi:MAG: hypothetical protein A2722_00545 [Candidatus Doudnabacteria bacterium RIFCSPHIGHO2_01_FULL_50_11]|uniref:RCK N-terminal domain-containing protein n=1 Tax=Candidatus Doudnabacteria bacterium RIFCSPHIGHO2_01_FULL_50_11 TaxID=1817828 RepID=A0A1F5PH04_9BACT|nr:MAG: hypothetical protein A2722_00545 [Candidatus Doudnabacteria bacterium RIFCSPHIGHO2_01_FULL_50_11]HLC44345.1 cation:proton antiporter [Patescibacteria group bacterium]